MQQTPLYRALLAYRERNAARFHMPGHKGAAFSPFGDCLAYDVTEVQGTDSLFEASGPLLETEEQLAALYGARRTLLSAGGSTLCIQTMLALAATEGQKVIAGRNLHLSAVNAMALLGIEPVFVYPDGSSGAGIGGRILPQELEDTLCRNPDAAAVYITSPDYFGVLSDIPALSAVCRRYGVPLLVDNAHGAHLRFLSPSMHPINQGADLCCDSLHKTMPALTGAALLHIAQERFIPAAKQKMALFASTSPSYLIMLSIDRCIDYMQTAAKEDMQTAARLADTFRQQATGRGLALPQGMCDPCRLSLLFAGTDMTGARFGTLLRQGGIEPEYLSDVGCVLLLSAFNRPDDFVRLSGVLEAVQVQPAPSRLAGGFVRPRRAVALRQAVLAPCEEISVDQAQGRIAAQSRITCPPGVPVVVSGEEIDKNVVAELKKCGIATVFVLK